MKFLSRFFKKKRHIFIDEQDVSDRYTIEHLFLPTRILGEHGSHLISQILEEKGNFFIRLYKALNDDVPDYQCPYSSEQFLVECSQMDDIDLNDLYVLKITMPAPETTTLCGMIIITYDENMSSRRYITVEKSSEDEYDMCGRDKEFNHLFYGTYSEERLLTLIKGDYDYSSAPKTAIKRKALEFLTNWQYPNSLFVGAACLEFLRYTIKSIFGDFDFSFIIAFLLLFPMYQVFKNIKKIAKIYVDEQGIIEINERKYLSHSIPLNYQTKVKRIKSNIAKNGFKLGSFLICISAILIIAIILSIQNSIIDITMTTGEGLNEDKIYKAETMYILESYAQEHDDSLIYYYAAFVDKNKTVYFLSFNLGKKKNIEAIVAKDYELEPSRNNAIPISVYFKITELSGTLRTLFQETCTRYVASSNEYYYLAMNAEYICSTGENIFWNAIITRFSFILAVAILLIGICIFFRAFFIHF